MGIRNHQDFYAFAASNPKIQFKRVTNSGDFCPAQLNNYDNFKTITYDEFENDLKK